MKEILFEKVHIITKEKVRKNLNFGTSGLSCYYIHFKTSNKF